MNSNSLIDDFIKKQGVVILDGGLATELENQGHDLNHRLWSARLLIHDPESIIAVHRSYLEAGADCIITASYQATISGLMDEGISEKKAKNLIKKTVDLACDARDAFLDRMEDMNRLKPLIAASIGPYGAYLANGAEYRGDYQLSVKELKDFHLPRWELLSDTSADFFACETIPSILEAQALSLILADMPNIQAWMSFSCKDGAHISDGTPIVDCISLFDENPGVIAIGINCTSPDHILSLIGKITEYKSTKRIIVYPNSGERFDPHRKKWWGIRSADDFSQLAVQWYKAGARLIGGCCRTGPDYISAIRKTLIEYQMTKSQ
jgi:homocysteine S-methyltransferase